MSNCYTIKRYLLFFQDGKLYIEIPNSIPPWSVRQNDKYCIDTFVYEEEDGTKTTKLDALVCSVEVEYDYTNMLVSCTCEYKFKLTLYIYIY